MSQLRWSLSVKFFRKKESDALLPTLGGQTSLNMAMECESGILEELSVELFRHKTSAIDRAEDRGYLKNFAKVLENLYCRIEIATTVEEAVAQAKEIGYPIIVRQPLRWGNWRRNL